MPTEARVDGEAAEMRVRSADEGLKRNDVHGWAAFPVGEVSLIRHEYERRKRDREEVELEWMEQRDVFSP